jgi:hypothetical protein
MNAPPEMGRAPGKGLLVKQDQNTSDAKNTTTRADLKQRLDAIDHDVVDSGKSKVADLWLLEKHAMWRKGREVLSAFPQLENPRRGGRGSTEVSFATVAEATGRTEKTISGWTRLFLTHKDESEFLTWAKEQAAVVLAKWEARQLPPPPAPINWEVKIGESANVAPPLDPAGVFFTITKPDDHLVVVRHSDTNEGHYVISRCAVLRGEDGDVVGIEGDEEVLRPLKAHAVGIFLEQFGCTRADMWLRLPASAHANVEEVAAAA